jgi:ABC-type polysaccharide/polyol phosphate transport system ATPase subunit
MHLEPKALEMRGVSKRFRKGELYDSLRDAIPGIARKLLGRKPNNKPNVREFWALRDINLDVKPGEVLGIIGHNGAGKSTMLKLLSGILKPTSGTIAVNGRLSALIEISAGFHPDLTGRENVYLNGTILGMNRTEIARRFDQIVDFSGLEEFLDTPVKRYSSGMHARLGFAVAAHVDPDILIVDEVLSVGDYSFQNRCVERMRQIIQGGAAVVFVSHNLNAVASLCSRLILLDHGQIIREGDPQDVIRAYLTENRIDTESPTKDAYVCSFVIRDEQGPKVRFQPGDEVWVDVEVRANRACERLSLSLYLKDENGYQIFDTSTERLGHPPFSLAAGETYRCTLRLTLHLASGSFYFGTIIFRYDIQRLYDESFPMGTVFITSDTDVRGVANLYPQVETDSTLAATEQPA